MKRIILSVVLILCACCMFGQKDDFAKLAEIKGVKRLHFDKELFDKGMSVDVGSFQMDVGAGDIDMNFGEMMPGKVEDLQIFSCEKKKASAQLKKEVRKLLKDNKYQTLMNVKDDGDDGAFVNMYMCQVDEKTQIVFLGEDEEGIKLIVLMGKFDLSELVAKAMNDEEEAQKMSLSVKTHNWEDDDEDEKEPRKYKDCLIVIDGKIYPDLHTQDEAVRYMFDHNMDWSGSPKDMNVLEKKDVKKKYPNSKKKMAFEYTTSKGQK